MNQKTYRTKGVFISLRKKTMSLEAEKIRLVDAIIQVKDINLLHQLRDVLNKGKSDKYSLSADQIEELEARRLRHKKGLSKSYSWDEAKELIRK